MSSLKLVIEADVNLNGEKTKISFGLTQKCQAAQGVEEFRYNSMFVHNPSESLESFPFEFHLYLKISCHFRLLAYVHILY